MEHVYEIRTALGEYLGEIDCCDCYADALRFAKWLYESNDITIRDVTDLYEDE